MPVTRLIILGAISICLGVLVIVYAGPIQRFYVKGVGIQTSRIGRAMQSGVSSPMGRASTQFSGGLLILAGLVLWIVALMDLVARERLITGCAFGRGAWGRRPVPASERWSEQSRLPPRLPAPRRTDGREPGGGKPDCVTVHEGVPERLPRRELVVEAAEHPEVGRARRAASRQRHDVVQLQASRRAADAPGGDRPLAPAAVAGPDLELREEALRDRDVEPAQVGGERLDVVANRGPEPRWDG